MGVYRSSTIDKTNLPPLTGDRRGQEMSLNYRAHARAVIDPVSDPMLR